MARVFRAPNGSGRFPPIDAGFTLIEVLVALVLLASMAMGVAPLFAVATATARDARGQSSTATLAMEKLEQLRSLAWGYDRNVPANAISDLSTDLSVEPATAAGTGLSSSPAGTLDRNTHGYVDYLNGAGQWVGTGQSVSPNAVFIRRWSVQPLQTDALNTLVLQVLVTTVAREGQRRVTSGTRAKQAGDTLIIAMKTRKAW